MPHQLCHPCSCVMFNLCISPSLKSKYQLKTSVPESEKELDEVFEKMIEEYGDKLDEADENDERILPNVKEYQSKQDYVMHFMSNEDNPSVKGLVFSSDNLRKIIIIFKTFLVVQITEKLH